MDESIHTITSSLLARARARDQTAWGQLVDIYGPLVYRWCLRRGLSAEDAADVGQEVFLAVTRSLVGYKHENFRGWLHTITRNKLRDFWEKRARQPQGEGGTDGQRNIDQQPDPLPADDPATEREDDKVVYLGILDLVRDEFRGQDAEAFRRVVLEDKSPADVAMELGITRNQVYLAKARILRRLRAKFGEGDGM